MKYRMKRHPVVQPLDQSIKLIPLTRGQNAIVDAVDYDRLCQFNWYARWCEDVQSFYAIRNINVESEFPKISMHTEITGFERTDHRNHDTLDNRRSNLRECSSAQNSANSKKPKNNTSGVKGVHWHKSVGRWVARITVNRTEIHLGLFTNPEDAARAYDDAAKKYFGEFAHTNF